MRTWSTTKAKATSSSTDNGTAKGWGKKKVGGLHATFKGKPELSADHFDGLFIHKSGAITGGGDKNEDDIKDHIDLSARAEVNPRCLKLYGKTLIYAKQGLKSIIRAGKKEGYTLNKAELGTALDEMNDAGAFSDIELDGAALPSLIGMVGEQQQASANQS